MTIQHSTLAEVAERVRAHGMQVRESNYQISFDVPELRIPGLEAVRFTVTEMAAEPLDLAVMAEAVVDGQELRLPHPSLQVASAVCEANASDSIGGWIFDSDNGQLAYRRWLPCEWLVCQTDMATAVIEGPMSEWRYRFRKWQDLARKADSDPAAPSFMDRLCGMLRKGVAL